MNFSKTYTYSQNQPNSWIYFDFIERRVKFEHSMFIFSQFFQSKIIEESNIILSEVKDSPYLNSKHVVHLFPFENSDVKFYRSGTTTI